MDISLKRTAFYDFHVNAGAKLVPFAGYEMPVSYSSISEEHLAVRNGVGLFDVSHMGQFIVKGKEAYDLVQSVSSNDAAKLLPGEAQYSCLPNEHGGVVDDLLVYRLFEDQCAAGEQAYMLVVNASNIVKDWEWIKKANAFDTQLVDISDRTSLLALQGPRAESVLQKLTDVVLKDIQYYQFTKGTVAGVDNVLISATGYTGAGGFELYFENVHSEKMWTSLLEAGQEFQLNLCGLGARDTLRLEKGYCLYGHELKDDISPIEAGLKWIVKYKKKEDFFSKGIYKDQVSNGTKRQLIGLRMKDRRIPRQGYAVLNSEDQIIGEVTSGTMSPSLEVPIAMALVNTAAIHAHTEYFVEINTRKYPADRTNLPFL